MRFVNKIGKSQVLTRIPSSGGSKFLDGAKDPRLGFLKSLIKRIQLKQNNNYSRIIKKFKGLNFFTSRKFLVTFPVTRWTQP
jgi:hypothetical protein